MNKLTALACLVAVGVTSEAQLARADAVTDWNAITISAVNVGRAGPQGSLDIALVQIAVHDAVQALDKRFEPYHVEIVARRARRLLPQLQRRTPCSSECIRRSRPHSMRPTSNTWLTKVSPAMRD